MKFLQVILLCIILVARNHSEPAQNGSVAGMQTSLIDEKNLVATIEPNKVEDVEGLTFWDNKNILFLSMFTNSFQSSCF